MSVELIKNVNRAVLKNLEVEDHVVPGEIRTVSVVAGPYRAAPAEDCEYLLEELCTWLNGPVFRGPPQQQIPLGFIKAALAHLYLAWIHAFGDGNGRTARLIEFRLLVEAGVPVPAAYLLSNHYNDTRTAYYRELNNASKSGGDVLPFLHYAAQGWVDNLREQLERVHEQQHDLAWRDFVGQVIKKSGQAHEVVNRQRALVNNLTGEPPSTKSQIFRWLAAEYLAKTEKTLSRDLNKLRELGLLEESDRKWKASDWRMYNFLPPQLGAPSHET
jgi:Fic family protein